MTTAISPDSAENLPTPVAFRAQKLEALSITHGFFGRQGGVSPEPCASLNCGFNDYDTPDNTRENRHRVAATFGRSLGQLYLVRQVHGDQVAVVTGEMTAEDIGKLSADALVTNRSGILLGALTADCAPVLFADAEASVVGSAHAGWRGAIKGICQQTIQAMVQLGAEVGNITAAIGPCIKQASYEVGEDVREIFLEADSENERFFAPNPAGRDQFDLAGYIRKILRQSGLTLIETLDHDTYSEVKHFYSYRRATHQNTTDAKPANGTQISVISL